jgi:hypothetical protein
MYVPVCLKAFCDSTKFKNLSKSVLIIAVPNPRRYEEQYTEEVKSAYKILDVVPERNRNI